MTRTGGPSEQAKASLSDGETLRHRTICCGLKKAVRSQQIADLLRSYAVDVGVCKRVVTLIANEVLLGAPAPPDIRDWFLWYTRVWSAVDVEFGAKGMAQKNPLLPRVREVLHRRSDLMEEVKKHYAVCTVMMRNRECDGLAVATVEHLRSFPSRLERYLRVFATEMLWEDRRDTSFSVKVAKIICGYVLSSQPNGESLRTGLVESLGECDLVDFLENHAMEERAELGDLVEEGESNWYYVTRKMFCKEKSDNVAAVLPHLIRYSKYMSQVQKQEFGEKRQRTRLAQDEEEYESDTEEENAVCLPCSSVCGKWTRNTTPRPFSVLPIWKLQPCMAMFTWTEVNALYGKIHAMEMEEWKKRVETQERNERVASAGGMSKTRKRKRESETHSPKAEIPRPVRFEPDRVLFAKTLFNDDLPVSLPKTQHWWLVSFRTDGVQLSHPQAHPIRDSSGEHR